MRVQVLGPDGEWLSFSGIQTRAPGLNRDDLTRYINGNGVQDILLDLAVALRRAADEGEEDDDSSGEAQDFLRRWRERQRQVADGIDRLRRGSVDIFGPGYSDEAKADIKGAP